VRAEPEAEELYDEASVYPHEPTTITTVMADDDDEELYQDAGDTRQYSSTSARALYDYQAGQFSFHHRQ